MEHKLTAFDGLSEDHFGQRVAMDGDTVLVGAPNSDDVGAVYVYVWDGAELDPSGEDHGCGR